MVYSTKQINSYRLLTLIARGGMGEVYIAEDQRLLRQVAFKVIPIDALLEAVPEEARLAIAHFEREARTIAQLDHPFILPIYDCGTTQIQGVTVPYLVMPLRKEGSLHTWLRQYRATSPLSLEELAQFLLQAADALQHAHDAHIIHRDVKPANFLMRSRRGAMLPDIQLADFGIAKLTDATLLTGQGVRGTPLYMAPEQWHAHPTYATDQYALAAMVYQLLAGQPPFRGNQYELMYQQLSAQPLPPSRVNPALPREIDPILLKALAKAPQDRFPSVLAFALTFEQAIRTIRQSRSIQKQPTSLLAPFTPSVLPNTPAPIPAPPTKQSQNLSTGMQFSTYRCPYGVVYSLAWISSRCYVAIGDAEGKIQVWDSRTNSLRSTFQGHTHEIKAILWSPHDTRIASYAYQEKEIHVWDTSTGQKIATYGGHMHDVTTAAWSPDGIHIASSEEQIEPATIHIWNTTTGVLVTTYIDRSDGPANTVQAITWAPDNLHIAITLSAMQGNRMLIYLWNVAKGSTICAYGLHAKRKGLYSNGHELFATTWSPDGKQLSFHENHSPYHLLLNCLYEHVWEMPSQRLTHTRTYFDGRHRVCKTNGLSYSDFMPIPGGWSPDSASIATGIEKTVQVWNARTGENILVYQDHIAPVTKIAWSPGGARIASASDTAMHIWDSTTGKTIMSYQGRFSHLGSLIWSPDSSYVASIGRIWPPESSAIPGVVHVWDAVT